MGKWWRFSSYVPTGAHSGCWARSSESEVDNITRKSPSTLTSVWWSGHHVRHWTGIFRQNIVHKKISFRKMIPLTTREGKIILKNTQIPNVEQHWKSHCSEGRLDGTEVSRDAPLEGRWKLMLLYLAKVYGCVSSSVPRVMWGREGLLWDDCHNER